MKLSKPSHHRGPTVPDGKLSSAKLFTPSSLKQQRPSILTDKQSSENKVFETADKQTVTQSDSKVSVIIKKPSKLGKKKDSHKST